MSSTPSPTAEQVFEVAMQLAAMTLGQTVSGRLRKSDLAHYLLRNVPLARGLLSDGAPSEDALRDAVDHIRGAVEFQDTISPEAVRVLTDAAILDRPKIQDPATTTLVAEAREWAKYDSTGASKIVIELCNALTAAGVAPQEPSEELRIEEDYSHIYWRDPLEGCWVAYRRADCVGEEELPPTTLAAQPVLDPEKVADLLDQHHELLYHGGESGGCVCGHIDGRTQEAHQAEMICEAAKRGELS